MMLLIGNRHKQKRAFTFLELLLVLVVISVLLNLSAPLIKRSVKKSSFNSFVSKMYLFLDYAKTRAILNSKSLETIFDLDVNEVFLIEQGIEDQELFKIKIPKDILIELETEKIIFYPDGTLQEFEISVTGSLENKSIISSKGFDGKIKIFNEK